MAGGNHDAAGGLELRRREIHLFRSTKPNVDDIAARLVQTRGEGILKGRTTQANVAPKYDRTFPKDIRRRATDAACDVLVQFVGNTTPNVIGLEAAQRIACIGHRQSACSSSGRILKRSPTKPMSAISKIDASPSLLMATIVPASLMPVRCWMAPEIPMAMYSSGAMILPVWPTCSSFGT